MAMEQHTEVSQTIEALLKGLSEDQRRAMKELPDPCGDWADNASLLAETYIHTLILERQGHELRLIDSLLTDPDAVSRRCERCGEAIPLARLAALPTATTCIVCQEQVEATLARERALCCAARTDPYD
jgi:DnaK suppressor protein